MSINYDAIDKAIDYQVGDVIVPKEKSIKAILCMVKDITEKGAIVAFVEDHDVEFLIPNHELHLMKKHSTGSILYGKKG
jgi:hypothetical protein